MAETKISLFEKKIGDTIEVELAGFGKFIATLQAIDVDYAKRNKSYIFLFDDCIAIHAMNKWDTNEGGYEQSELKRWLDSTVRSAFPEEIQRYLSEVSIPTAGMIFGQDNDWCNDKYVMDSNKQFPLMKKRQNRIACYEDDTCWWWLRNATKKNVSAARFASVYNNGSADYSYASNSPGVHPVFTLVKPIAGDPVSRETKNFKIFEEPGLIDLFSILADCEKKKEELKKQKAYISAAEEVKAAMDSFVKVGFTEEQAFELIKIIFANAANMGGHTNA